MTQWQWEPQVAQLSLRATSKVHYCQWQFINLKQVMRNVTCIYWDIHGSFHSFFSNLCRYCMGNLRHGVTVMVCNRRHCLQPCNHSGQNHCSANQNAWILHDHGAIPSRDVPYCNYFPLIRKWLYWKHYALTTLMDHHYIWKSALIKN